MFRQFKPFTLGVADTTPLEMASAYAVAPADSKYCEPLPVLSIKDPAGEEVGFEGTPVAQPRCRQAVSEATARAATDVARCVAGYGAARGRCGGWSTAGQVAGIVGRPVAGKTGTTDGNRTASFIGFTPQLAIASFTPTRTTRSTRSAVPVPLESIETVSRTIHDALAGEPVAYFKPPPDSIR